MSAIQNINPISTFEDDFIKRIEDFGSVDSGVIYMSRPYDFTLTGTKFSTSGNLNYFQHLFDQSVYPNTLLSASGWGVYATASNSSSGYYYTTLMQLFNYGVLQNTNGLFSVTSLTSSISSFNLMNSGKFDMSLYQGNPTIYQTLSANVTGVYIYNFNREVYGDRIFDGSLVLLNNGVTAAYDNQGISKNSGIYTLTSSLYSDTLTSATRFWVLPDIGKVISWSSDNNILNSLSGVNEIQFKNTVAVANTTINLRIEPDEYNASENFSFYLRDYTSGEIPDTFITSIGLFNDFHELLAVCKLQKPIRKSSSYPITIKIILDHF